jgi:hypothetical protein
MPATPENAMTPLEKAEALYEELVGAYDEGADRQLRAAAKLLMVALDRIQAHGGDDWQRLVGSYIEILAGDPERFRRMLDSQRGAGKAEKTPF